MNTFNAIDRIRTATTWIRANRLRARSALLGGSLGLIAGCLQMFGFINIAKEDQVYPIIALLEEFAWGDATLPDEEHGYQMSPVRPLAAGSDAVTLATFTPTAAFRGNQLAIVGAALQTGSLGTAAFLARAADCTFTQYGATDVNGPTTALLATLPGAGAYLYGLTGQTSSAAFAGGCQESGRGTAVAPGAYLGKASNGDLLAAAASIVNLSTSLVLGRVTPQGVPVSKTTLATVAAPLMAVADFNGDTIADIVTPFVTSGGTTGVGVYLSNADGSFGAVTVYTGLAASADPTTTAVSIDDVSGDGKPDIVALSQEPFLIAPAKILTLLGNGAGAFSAGPSRSDVPLNGPLVLGDFDGDAKKDALIAPGGTFLKGNGDGSFAAPVQRLTAFAPLRYLAKGDFNADGKLDVAATIGPHPPNVSRFVSIYLGNGDGTFTTGAVYAAAYGVERIGVTDVDGDGRLDIATGIVQPGVIAPDLATKSVIQFMFGLGTGAFTAERGLPGTGVPAGLVTPHAPTFALADFDGDTFPDLVTAAERATFGAAQPTALVRRPGAATGRFAAAQAAVALAITPQLMASGDLNADGKPDLIVLGTTVGGAPALATSLGQGAGSFAAPSQYALSGAPNAFLLGALAAADFNGDGRADVAVKTVADGAGGVATSGTFVLIANTDGTLKAPVKIDAVTKAGPLTVGDFNGDTRADLAVGDRGQFTVDTANSVRVYRGNADGTFTTAQILTPAAYYLSLGAGDLNGDGRRDLVIGGNDTALTAKIFVLAGQANGTFGAPSTFTLQDGFSTSLQALAVADFTNDGHLDVMAARDRFTEVLAGAGDGTLIGENSLIIATQADYLQAVDLDHDGISDAAAATHLLGLVPLLRTSQAIPDNSSPPPSPPSPTPDYAVTASSSALTVAAGQSTQTTLTVTPQGGFAAAVTFTCSGLPTGASCSFSPATVTPNGGAAQTTLAIATNGGTVAQHWPVLPSPSLPFALAAVTLVWTGAARQLTKRARGQLWRLALLTFLAWGATSCGGGSGGGSTSTPTPPTPPPTPPAVGTPAGTSNVTVTAVSGTGAGALTHSVVITLNVTR